MLVDLKPRDTFQFKSQTWKVAEAYIINWRDNTTSYEYQIKTHKNKTRYLEIELDKNNNATYSFWKKLATKSFPTPKRSASTVDSIRIGKLEVPKTLKYNGVVYTFDEQVKGKCRYEGEMEQITSFDFLDASETKFLSFELWEDELEISTGYRIFEDNISNVVKAPSSIKDSVLFSKYFGYAALLVILFFGIILNNTNDDYYYNSEETVADTSKVGRSNNSYRGRNSGGYGK